MAFLNQILLARNVQGTLESFIGRANKTLVFTFGANLGPAITQTTRFDIIESYSHNQSVRVTENPVEQGFNINDHRIQQPTELQIRVGTSNIIDPITAAATLDPAAIRQAATLQVVGSRVANTRIQATYSELTNAMRNSDVFNLSTPMGLLRNFLIVGIENENNAESATTFEGLLTLQEILTFESIEDRETDLSGVNQRPVVTNPTLTPVA